jgi:hypothetical protein
LGDKNKYLVKTLRSMAVSQASQDDAETEPGLRDYFEMAADVGETKTEETDIRQSMTFNNMIRASVTLGVGVLIVGEIFNSLPTPDGALSNASDTVESTTGDAFELAPVVLIVIVAGLILGAVRGF